MVLARRPHTANVISSKGMSRKYIEFEILDDADQEWFLKETWCDICDQADLGIINPKIYSENGKEYIEGKCRVCGESQISEIIIRHKNEK